MTDSLVAIDLETTGLDPRSDAIIEIGAVRFDIDGTMLDTFSTFVDAGRDIPLVIERLTGIRQADIEGAPRVGQALRDLADFVGGAPVVGHNIGFDLAFIRNAGGAAPDIAIDTAEVSRLVLPNLPSHALGAVAGEMGVPLGDHHRALNDAEVAARLLCALGDHARQLAPDVRVAVGRALPACAPLSELFRLEGLTTPVSGARGAELLSRLVDTGEPRELPPPLRPAPQEQAIPLDRIERVFEAAREHIPGFEARAPQLDMSLAVAQAFNGEEHWLIEAGTGVGKSLAYLVPAALYAMANGRRVVISTNTINLQEQLITKDVPLLRRLLRAAGFLHDDSELRVSTLKGRGNYLCRQRLEAHLAASMGDPTVDRLVAMLASWLPETETGDRGELNLPPPLRAAWSRISAQDADCLARRNRFVGEGSCFMLRARREAEAAHIVIVNHALLLTDSAAGGTVIPAFDHLVIDEAHHIEDVATQQFGESFTAGSFLDVVDGIGRPGEPASLLGRLYGPSAPVIRKLVDTLSGALDDAPGPINAFFNALLALRFPATDDRLALDERVMAGPQWTAVRESWVLAESALQRIAVRGRELATALLTMRGANDHLGDLATELSDRLATLSERKQGCAELVRGEDDGQIRWVTRRSGRDTAMISGTPLAIGPLLREEIFENIPSVVATSATLATGTDMKFSAHAIGLDDARMLQLPSPFDYDRLVLLGAVRDVAEPQSRMFTETAADSIEELVLASGGRALVLCTSRSMVEELRNRLREPLESEGIVVVAQGVDGSPRQVVENLRTDPRTLVIGTSSLWEGVDIPGDTLSLVIIPRLPFAVPSDPVQQARGRQFANPFRDYSLPSAVLRFRQGFGRLVRTPTDRGAVIILDRRIAEKGYGRTFMKSLPGYTPIRADSSEVAREVHAWLQT